MDFLPIHIHKTRYPSHISLLALFVPILIFAVVLALTLFKEPEGSVSGVSTSNNLTESVK